LTAEGDNLPNPSRIVRYVGYGKMRRDEDDNFIGPNPAAFELRPHEHDLSVTWCEYFQAVEDVQLRCAIEIIRCSRDVGSMACFCVADAQEVLAAVSDAGRIGRAVYRPVVGNQAHAGVCGLVPEEAQLLERLASEVWSTFLTKNGADALPVSECAKSHDVV
jgi:hypothetical protein